MREAAESPAGLRRTRLYYCLALDLVLTGNGLSVACIRSGRVDGFDSFGRLESQREYSGSLDYVVILGEQ